MVTIFENFLSTKPYYKEIDFILKRIKACTLQTEINAIRTSEGKAKSELKKKLPCICFSGKFSKRDDKSIVEHSGFAVLDFDHVNNPSTFRDGLKQYQFIYSAFISPSGDGVKAVVRIPKDKTKHRGYYEGILRVLPDADRTSINISRICFESVDANLWINENAIEFTNYIDIAVEAKEIKKIDRITTNYSKVNIALEMVRNSIDGQKHTTLLKASKLMGGYIASGAVDESEAIRLLETEIQYKDIDDPKQATKTIKDGINYGKQNPIEVKEYELKPATKVILANINYESQDYIAKKEDVENYLHQWRTDTFVKGVTTGLDTLDKYYNFKRANFNVFNGFDNVGKSTTLWYLLLLSSMYHDWKWIIYSAENRAGNVFKRLIEFYWGESIKMQNEMKFNNAKKFIEEHFTIIANDAMYSFKDILTIAEIETKKKKYDGILLDPYNALKIDLDSASKLSTHEYHYEAASEMQLFAKRNDMCVYLNCHVVTSAMRMGTAPGKADTEGGGKFANKADDFVTIHRKVQDSVDWMKTELHVRKIKEVETGGGYTPHDNPFILSMQAGMCRFEDINGTDPIREYHRREGNIREMIFKEPHLLIQPTIIQPNTNFETEPF
jgi:hypothetical protein